MLVPLQAAPATAMPLMATAATGTAVIANRMDSVSCARRGRLDMFMEFPWFFCRATGLRPDAWRGRWMRGLRKIDGWVTGMRRHHGRWAPWTHRAEGRLRSLDNRSGNQPLRRTSVAGWVMGGGWGQTGGRANEGAKQMAACNGSSLRPQDAAIDGPGRKESQRRINSHLRWLGQLFEYRERPQEEDHPSRKGPEQIAA